MRRGDRGRTPTSLGALLVLSWVLVGRAGAQVDPSGSWRTLHTPHFRIHFRPTYRDAARLEAQEAERAWGLLASELHPPREVVDITLGDDVDGSNGFTTVVPSSRITIFAPPPAGDHGLLPHDTWLRLVTTHELTHVFHLDRSRSIWAVFQRVFGRLPGLFPNEYQPSWVIEGLATYYESKFTNGGRVRGSFHTQLLAIDHAAAVSRSPADAVFFSRWSDGLVPYAYGSRFFQALATAAGDSVVPRFVEATSAQLIPFRVGRQVSRVAAGRTLDAEWVRGTQPGPGPEPAPAGTQVLARGLWTEPVPAVSADGRRVAYVWDDGKGASELHVLDAVTFRQEATHLVNGGVGYDWLGDTLIVAQLDYTTPWQLRSDLYRWVPGGAWRRETRGARIVEPEAGGGRLAAIALAAATSRPTVSAPASGGDATWGSVVPSPDGRWMAGSRNLEGRWSLLRWPADSPAAARTLIESQGILSDLAWTPDGELWFVADPTGFPQVYCWRDSGRAVPRTADPFGARAPAALADGTLLYAALTAHGWELRHAPTRGGDAVVTFPGPLRFDSAPPPPERETGYTMWPSLRPHYWIPFFVNAGPSGRFVGAVTAGSDALGRFSYVADAYVAPQPVRAAGDLTLVTAALGNPILDLTLQSGWHDLLPPPGANVTLSELDQSAALGASFVRRWWRGAASARVAAELTRTAFTTLPDTALAIICPGCKRQTLAGGSLTLALARLVTGALSVSPEDGFAWSATYRRREEEGTSRWSNEFRSRLAFYLRAPGPSAFAHHVLAVRLAAGATGGPIGALFKVGGVSSGPLGLAFGQVLGVTGTFPVRGYRYGELLGQRAASATVEYRVPLALLGHSLGHLPVGADKAWLNVFADAGDAWTPGAQPVLARLRSTGVELATGVNVSYDLRLTVRVGVAEPLAPPPSGSARRPRVYAGLASDF